MTMESTDGALSPLRFTANDELTNSGQIIKNFSSLAFKDWPNEAGFDHLEEHRGPIELVVRGDIPAWASGSLYRTGPGVCSVRDTPKGTFDISHWFDGLAHTHRFEIVASSDEDAPTNSKVRVFYSSRRQADGIMEDIKHHGTYRAMTFAQRADPCVGLFAKFMSVFKRPAGGLNIAVTVNTDLPAKAMCSRLKANTSATPNGEPELGHRASAKNVFLATDVAVYMEVDPATLEPVGTVNQSSIHPDLKGRLSGAHGKRDPVTGDFFNFNTELGRTATYRIFQIVASTGEVKILATISGNTIKAAYIHSFFSLQVMSSSVSRLFIIKTAACPFFGQEMFWMPLLSMLPSLADGS
ncbi:unnamed protein product [Parascedosporium putredinis]|uniref:Uncharacterized protein n=1 Tax=Parascedosporium putredinis TaxID=1442378 RepID=A0A9P1H2Y0_9PEZI|nr:unnamed protein product [Parascedosporium putredinis]CAI7995248.1 unnamed protein product [Parascedosporium putredinis]